MLGNRVAELLRSMGEPVVSEEDCRVCHVDYSSIVRRGLQLPPNLPRTKSNVVMYKD